MATDVKVERGPAGPFTTASGREMPRIVRPEDLGDSDYTRDLGDPGHFPFTRGVHETMYRGRLWTMRQFAGFGTPRQTNERFKFLTTHGQTGLSTAFDLPTLMGRDSDDPLSVGEVGRCGVAVDSLADFEILFDGINLRDVSVSMTINAPAAILLAFYVAVADRQGVPHDELRGTCQNDILKEFHAQNEFVFPPAPSVKLVVDTVEFCTRQMPQYNPISISGYHIREAGSTAAQELAFTIYDGLAYVEACRDRGMSPDDFAPRLSFFFNCHNDFLEEIAKYRAARRLWARLLIERYAVKNPRALWLRFHAQTAGCTLYGKQPYVNIVRVAYQAMAAVLGGCQSLHTNSMDETLALPSEQAVTIALRTQQVLAYESGLAATVDPLAGSYLIEKLTNDQESEARDYIQRIDELGGALRGIETGFFRKEIANAAYAYSREVADKDKLVVGVNAFTENTFPPLELLKIEQAVEDDQVARLTQLKKKRDASAVAKALERIRDDASAQRNVMPALVDGAKTYATVGEMMSALEEVYGRYSGGVW
jgi:methylmalonyl-CoA mutase N-terminal domain/subunit